MNTRHSNTENEKPAGFHTARVPRGALALAASVLGAREDELRDVTVPDKGMTNRPFLFTCRGRRYIMRVPGEGTEQLIDRRGEAEVYRLLRGRGLSDNVLYIDPDTGYKLSEFIENARMCDAGNDAELAESVRCTRRMHKLALTVGHSFDIFGQTELYESLWRGQPCRYDDYAQTKRQVLSLRPFIETRKNPWVLTHMDPVAENYLITEEDGRERWYLIDWEYAGMQDPLVDMACVALYMFYDRARADWLLDIYFDGACPPVQRALTYCYISVCGLMWTSWCEYKRRLGVDFAEYSDNQYRMARDFYRYAKEEIERL